MCNTNVFAIYATQIYFYTCNTSKTPHMYYMCSPTEHVICTQTKPGTKHNTGALYFT